MTGFRSGWPGVVQKTMQQFANAVAVRPNKFGGVRVIPHDYHNIGRVIEQNLMVDRGDKEFVPSDIEPGPNNARAAKFLSLDVDNVLYELNDGEIAQATTVAVPGLGGGDNDRRLTRSLLGFRRFFPNSAIYSPICEGHQRRTRYAAAAEYYFDETSIIPQESENFFGKFILPKISENGKLRPPEKCARMVLEGFSIGSREIRSHVNYTREYLLKNGVPGKDEVQKYFDNMVVVNVGSPINWDQKSKSSRFLPSPRFINILSVNDMGSRKPNNLLQAVYMNRDCYENKLSLFKREDDNRDVLIVLGSGAVPHGDKNHKGVFVPNPLGHNDSNYFQGIANQSEVGGLMEKVNKFANGAISVGDLNASIEKTFASGKKLEHPRKLPTQEEVAELMHRWMSYSEQERARESSLTTSETIVSAVKSCIDPALLEKGSICAEEPKTVVSSPNFAGQVKTLISSYRNGSEERGTK